jgi:hypothetical protein
MYYQREKMTARFVITFVFLSLSFFAFNVFVACESKPISQPPIAPVEPVKPVTPIVENPAPKIPLRWETNHPERYEWSYELFKRIDENFESLNKAKDLKSFCSKYDSLTIEKKKLVWASLFVELAYYESGFNPKSNSVDVGSKNDKRSWSVGLYQLSSRDSDNWKFPFTYSFTELQNPLNNIHMAVYLMGKIIDKRGLIALKSVSQGLYWAVLSSNPDYKYTKLNKIQAKVKALEFCN